MQPFLSMIMVRRPAALGDRWDASRLGSATASSDGATVFGPATQGNNLVWSRGARASGKWSFRVRTSGFYVVGLSWDGETGFPGATANGHAIGHGDTSRTINGGSATTTSGLAPGDTIDVLADLSAGRVWYVVNGLTVYPLGADPSVTSSGYTFSGGVHWTPAVCMYSPGSSATLDTSMSRWAGFPAWGLGDFELFQSIPYLTSVNQPAGHAAQSRIDYSSGYQAFYAFDNSPSTEYAGQGSYNWIQRQTPDPIKLGGYKFRGRETSGTMILLGSNDGSNFTELHRFNDSAGTMTWQVVPVGVRAAYRFHRWDLNGTGPNSGAWSIDLLKAVA